MFCRNCGSELADDAKFCMNCGTKIDDEPEETLTDKVMNYNYKYKEYDRAALKQESKDAIKGVWFYLFLVNLLASLAGSTGIGIIISLIAPIPIFYITKGVLLFKKFDTDLLYKPFTKLKEPIILILKVLGASLLISLIFSLGILLFIIPGIYFMLCYSQTIYLLIDDPTLKITEAMEKSKHLMDGHKWEFFVFGLSFIGHILLVFITFGIYSIYAMPYTQTANFNYYCYLRGLEATKTSAKEIPCEF